MVDAALRIDLWFVVSRAIGQLSTTNNVKVIISGVAARVAFSPDCCPKNDEVLGNGSMDDIHGSHGSTGIIEDPFFLYAEVRFHGRDFAKLRDNARHYSLGLVVMLLNCVEGDLVELLGSENVELFEVGLEDGVDTKKNSCKKDPER